MMGTSAPYFAELFDRAVAALAVPPHPEMSDGDPRFQPNRCHPNSEEYCRANPSFEVMRGWLVNLQGADAAMFEAHSIVRSRLDPSIRYDVTPIRASGLVFVEHLGDLVIFENWSRTPQIAFFRSEVIMEMLRESAFDSDALSYETGSLTPDLF